MTKKTQPVEEQAEETATEAAEVKPTKKAKKTSFDVMNGSDLVRSYSLEAHGDNAEELAHEFAAQYPGYTVV